MRLSRTRTVIIGAVAFLLLSGLLIHEVAAPLADSRFNPVAASPPYDVAPSVLEVHGRLLVADMHSDMLLWARPHERRGTRGHMDIPRLREGNVALQVFSVVTKSPWGQSYDANSSDSDRITMLAVAQGWPPRTWKDLNERALYQASVLRELADEPGNGVRLIRTRADLDRVVAARAPG